MPTSADADGDTLAFSIQNRPAWATFNTSTGRLSGTPSVADVGTYSNISISVSDGQASTALNGFAIAVNAISTAAPRSRGRHRPRTRTAARSPNLAGYRIRYGTSASSLTQTIVIDNASVTTYVVENLAPATWYFAVTAVSSAGAESTYSNVANKRI